MTTTQAGGPGGAGWRLARRTAPLAQRFAGRRFFPLWAVLHHRGRRTGRALSVPIALLATPDTFVIALPYGAGTNWARNVLAAGECVVHWKGVDHRAVRPELLDRDRARPYYPRPAWAITQRIFAADAFLLLHRHP